MSLTQTQRKALQRRRDKALGWTEVTVKVARERAEDVRDFAASLPPPSPPTDPDQLSLLDAIEKAILSEQSHQHESQQEEQKSLF